MSTGEQPALLAQALDVIVATPGCRMLAAPIDERRGAMRRFT